MNLQSWRLEGHVARLSLPGLSLAFDADRPAEGLAQIAVGGRPWSGGHLLGINACPRITCGAGVSPAQAVGTAAPQTTLTDWLVRDDDLIAVYETGQPDAVRIDLLWHAARPAARDPWLARIDMLVSVRTDRLDWRHDVCLESVLPEMPVVETFDAMGNVFHEAARGWSLAVMVHPADLRQPELTAESETADGYHLRHPLFPTECLEKGVILRARARAWFLSSGVDQTAVAACFAEFAAADPPLGI
jgi:hypothetical protein